ncbi:MAG: antitoxin Xre/MbcA/ParS toxin-binding domain-containing protein [Sphingobacteriales bacterium]
MATLTKSAPGIAIPNFSNHWIESDVQIFKYAMTGVDTDLFYAFAETVKMGNKSLAAILHLSSRTISNYHQNKQTLEPVQGEHLLKLIALYDKGIEVFGSIEEFNYWLNKPFWQSNEKPFDRLVTPVGIDLILQELDQLAYGYPV